MKNVVTKVLSGSLVILVLLSLSSIFFKYVVLHEYSIFTDTPEVISNSEARTLIAQDALGCDWGTAPFLFFSENVFSQLIYYSHLFPVIGVIILAGLVWWRKNEGNLSNIFLILCGSYIVWSLFDLITWAHESPDLIMFFWSSMIFFELPIYAAGIYLIYNFIHSKNPPQYFNLLAVITVLPAILLAPTSISLLGFDYTNCDREALEGPLWQYVFLIEMLTTLGIFIYGFLISLKKEFRGRRKQILLLTTGLSLFFLSFSLGNIIGSFSEDWSIAQYGLLGMPIFLGFITYLIVQFKLYNLNIIGSQAFVVILWILIGSLLLVAQSMTTRIVAGFTLFAAVILGYILVRSVKQVVKQKEEIEKLAVKLEGANEKLKVLDKMKSEFVSIASHQLRSPLTSIRGYTSMLLEGSFGPLPTKAKDAIQRIDESSRFMASSVEDYLNVSRIQAGNMKYEYSDFNLKDLAERVADDTRQIAIKKGILVLFKSDMTKKGIVHADIGKTKQVLDNLINNAMKYTLKGSITVFVHDEPKKKKIFVQFIDTGIGMSPRTIDNIFGKFERADNANNINVTGTGLGLYIARKMAREMGGEITASSEGEGLGSIFTIELPLMM